MELFICRHGESIGNLVEYDYPDPELTDLGKAQAELLAQGLGCEEFDYIFCSPLVRALQTVYPVLSYQDSTVEVCTYMREVRGLESFSGLSGKEILQRYPRVRFTEEVFQTDRGWIDPGNETKQQAFERAGDVIDNIKHRFNENERVLIVAHGAFNGLLISYLLGLGLFNIRFQQDNACINRFIIRDDECKVRYINDCRHLIPLERFQGMEDLNDVV